MIDQINELPEDELKCSPETSRYTENKWISRKNQNELYFLHLVDILNDLLLMRISSRSISEKPASLNEKLGIFFNLI